MKSLFPTFSNLRGRQTHASMMTLLINSINPGFLRATKRKIDEKKVSLYHGFPMKDLAHNNLVRFKNISKKKEGIYANFKVKGIRGGTTFSASIVVDIDAAEVHAGDPLEKIIEECARIG